jgi:hypothetical protein
MFNFQNSSTLLVPAEPHLIHRIFSNQGLGDQWGQQGTKKGKPQRLPAGGGFWETVERADKQDTSRQQREGPIYSNKEKNSIPEWWTKIYISTDCEFLDGKKCWYGRLLHYVWSFWTSAGWLRDFRRLKESKYITYSIQCSGYKELLLQFSFSLGLDFKAQDSFCEPMSLKKPRLWEKKHTFLWQLVFLGSKRPASKLDQTSDPDLSSLASVYIYWINPKRDISFHVLPDYLR